MKATVRNLAQAELKDELVSRGYSLDDRLDIDFICEVSDELGLPDVSEPPTGFSQVGFYPQRKEDGTPYER